MAATCPRCTHALPWHIIQGQHACPSCGAALEVESSATNAHILIIWIIADIPLYFLMPDLWSRMPASIALGGAIAYMVCSNADTKARLR